MTRKLSLKKIALSVLFTIILAVSVYFTHRVLLDRDSINKNAEFFAEDNKFDVLFFGSSHMEIFVSPMELWNEYGLTSHNFGSPEEGLSVTYHVMSNAFVYNKPRVAVVDMHMYDIGGDYSNEAHMHYSLDSFPMTKQKSEAINDLSGDADAKIEMYFPLGRYHGRWKELTMENVTDTAPYVNGSMSYGYWHTMKVTPFEQNEITEEIGDIDTSSTDYYYLMKMIELCDDNDVKLLLVNTPYVCNPERQKTINALEQMAEGATIEYINFIRMGNVIDMSTDMYDDGHVNQSGMHKVTSYLGSYIVSNYDVEDHRGDTAYAGWNDDYDAYKDFKMKSINEMAGGLDVMLECLHDDDYISYVFVGKDACPDIDKGLFIQLLQNVGRENITVDTNGGVKSYDMEPLILINNVFGMIDYLMINTPASGVCEMTGSEATEIINQLTDSPVNSDEIVIVMADVQTEKVSIVRRY